ncbi:MAG: ABC transporter substrate-binding protein [Ignisphaera sp.]
MSIEFKMINSKKQKALIIIAIVIAITVGVLAYQIFVPSSPQNIYKPTTQLTYVNKEKIVVYAYRDVITGIDPGAEDDTGIVVLGVVYEPLLYYDPAKKEFKPALAVSWSRLNETSWLFKLRPNVRFHDGSLFTADAVRFTILRNKALYEEKGVGAGWIWDAIEDVIVLNNTALLFKLRYPAPVDLISSASYSSYIYCPNVLNYSKATNLIDDKIRLWFENGNDCGTGPYKIVSYKPESEIVLRKFDEWWGWKELNNPAAPDVVIIRIVEEPAQQESGLLSGDIDITTGVAKSSIPNLIKLGYAVYNQTTFHNYILMFNTRRWPTNITEFRLAIAYAIPWNEIVDFAFQGYGLLGSGLVPHGYPGYVPNLRYEYNLTKAKDVLDKLGIKDVKLEIVITAGYEEEERFASLLKSSLSQLEITLDIIELPWEQVKEKGASVWTKAEDAPHLIINDWWPTYPTPYDYLYILHSNDTIWNWSGFVNSDYDSLIDSALSLEGIDFERALEMYVQAQRIVFNNVIAVNLCDSVQPYLYDPSKIRLSENAFNPLYMYVIFFQYTEVLS